MSWFCEKQISLMLLNTKVKREEEKEEKHFTFKSNLFLFLGLLSTFVNVWVMLIFEKLYLFLWVFDKKNVLFIPWNLPISVLVIIIIVFVILIPR